MEINGGEIIRNELNKNAFGGSELMALRIAESVPKDLLKKFQIINSRVRDLDETKIRILVCHDLPGDPESKHLENEGWKKFHRIVFVSHWQRQQYIQYFGIPWSKTIVIENAIIPIDRPDDPEEGPIRLIYHTTPHRGLEILVPVFEKLLETQDNIHLDVFSSFKIYGWEDRDQQYSKLFDRIKNNEKMTYHGFQPNDVIREALGKAHIFAYPSIWPETSCISLIEAMSAQLYCVHPDLAALPETSARWTYMYNYDENPNKHAGQFYNALNAVIELVKENSIPSQTRLKDQKSYADLFYNWEMRKHYWEAFLRSIENEPVEMPKSMFVYEVK